MWVFTTDGFFSAVEHKDKPDTLVVRTRNQEDAMALGGWLADRGLETLIHHTPKADYHWRLFVPRMAFGQYLSDATQAIDYSNFKESVVNRQGPGRAHIYLDVWADLLALQDD